MPWVHGVLDEAEAKELFGRLGRKTTMVPYYLLVDASGNVVTASPKVNGHNLAEAVERALRN